MIDCNDKEKSWEFSYHVGACLHLKAVGGKVFLPQRRRNGKREAQAPWFKPMFLVFVQQFCFCFDNFFGSVECTSARDHSGDVDAAKRM